MAKKFERLEDDHRAFIERQHVFFVASSAGDSHVNLSPKGPDAFRVIRPGSVCYLDRTGASVTRRPA